VKNPILEELLSITEGIGLCWLGNIGWLLHTGDKLIAFDLDLENELRLKESPILTSEIAMYLDYHFVTHEHDDHFNFSTSRILAEQSKCIFIIPSNCKQKARQVGIPEERLKIAKPGTPFQLPDIDVHPVRAIHGHKGFTILESANPDDCGYKLGFGGKIILQPGDSILLGDHLEQKDVEVLFVSPTEHNMYIDKSAILIRTLNPDYIFPQHFGTYRETEENQYWTKGYPDELKETLSNDMQNRFFKLDQGELFVIH